MNAVIALLAPCFLRDTNQDASSDAPVMVSFALRRVQYCCERAVVGWQTHLTSSRERMKAKGQIANMMPMTRGGWAAGGRWTNRSTGYIWGQSRNLGWAETRWGM